MDRIKQPLFLLWHSPLWSHQGFSRTLFAIALFSLFTQGYSALSSSRGDLPTGAYIDSRGVKFCVHCNDLWVRNFDRRPGEPVPTETPPFIKEIAPGIFRGREYNP